MRLYFAILFAFASLFGPWLCCCFAKSVIAPVVEKAELDHPACCPLCRDEPAPKPKPSQPPVKPCPCQVQAPIEMIEVKAEAVADLGLTWLPDFVQSNLLLERVALSAEAASERCAELPFMTTWQRLFVHHAMRC